nr:BTB/POZ domain-containing protein 19 isoform X2 [Microcebus murinus]
MGGASSAPSSSFHRNPQASHPGAGVGRLPARPYPPASLPHPRPLQPRFLLAPPQAYSYPGAPGLRSPLPSGTWASLSYCPSASGLSSLTSSRARPGLLGRSLPHPWRAPDWWCAGRLRPFLQHSEASSTTPGTGCWQKRKILSPLDPESDVRFVVGQERQEVFAHRCLLACRCSFFQRLLGSEPGPRVPSPVVLSTVPAEAFLAVLEFLYTNSVKLHRHSVLEVLTAAVEYGLEELREVGFCARSLSHFPCLSWATSHPASQTLWPGEERVPTQRGVWMSFCLCLEFVVKVLDVELVCEALQVAVTFGLGPLQERCIAFIEAHSQVQLLIFILLTPHPILLLPDPNAANPQEALRTRGFLELSAPALLPLLRSDKLCVDEAELVWAARSWARVGAAVLERPVVEVAAPVVRELRLALLAPAELSALEEQNRREPFIPVRTRADPLSSVGSRRWGGGREEAGVALSGRGGTAEVSGDRLCSVGGADRRGVEVSRPAERG